MDPTEPVLSLAFPQFTNRLCQSGPVSNRFSQSGIHQPTQCQCGPSPTDSVCRVFTNRFSLLGPSPADSVCWVFTSRFSLLGPSPTDSVCWGLHQQIQSQSGPGPYTRALTGALHLHLGPSQGSFHLHLGPSQGHVTLQGKWQVCQVSSLRRQCVILQRPPVVCIW